ncbi:MAG: hypothetical protein A2Y38_07715 [Spirochaetes bacterium GWB1_59_5]|nr:MAG: hypothetical protein A2Y38_07715 [Spirochaetes bacterium GWB1_59_5]
MLRPNELMALFLETKGRLPGGGRWWLRSASRATVRRSLAFFVPGRGWFTGPHALPRDRAQLGELVRGRAALLRQGTP